MTIARYESYDLNKYKQLATAFQPDEISDCPVCSEHLENPMCHEGENGYKHPICLACAQKIACVSILDNKSNLCPTCRIPTDPNSVFTWKDTCIIDAKLMSRDLRFGAIMGITQLFGMIIGLSVGCRIGEKISATTGAYAGIGIGAALGCMMGSLIGFIKSKTKVNLGTMLATSIGISAGAVQGITAAPSVPTIALLAAMGAGSGGGALGAVIGGFFERRFSSYSQLAPR
jgi:hypothetical protein